MRRTKLSLPIERTSPVEAARRMSSAELTTAMVHFYRGEVQRSNTWRNRLDTTTNWAVLSAGRCYRSRSALRQSPFRHSHRFDSRCRVSADEARRYRYYEIWAGRVRVIEMGYYAPMLAPDSVPRDKEWASHLASDLLTPHFTISVWEAIGRRLRRNYVWIFALLALSWNLKVYLYPLPARNFDEFIDRATVGLVPGWIVFIVGFLFNAALFILAVGTLKLREATGEVLPRHEFSLHPLQRVSSWTRAASSVPKATVRRAKRARQRMRGTTGDLKKMDVTQTPDRRGHSTDLPHRSGSRSQHSGTKRTREFTDA
jgi:uncharacterized membrane protein